MSQSNRGFQARHDTRPAPPPIEVGDIHFGSISDELYAGIAEEKAKAIAKSGKEKQNQRTQLRRFYDELVLWNEKINSRGNEAERAERYAELAPLVKMLIAKVAYAKGRGHVDNNFEKLFRHVVAQVKDAKTLEQAKLFMEAFMGYYRVYKG